MATKRVSTQPARVSAAILLGFAEFAAVLAVFLALGLPARAQGFFDDRYPFMQDRGRRIMPGPSAPPGYYDDERPPDFSHAPAPKKPDTQPTSTVMVFGDAMADWLAYGLEDAFSDTPEIGIVRKHKTASGLIRYEPRRDTPDWAQAAREIVAAEKPNFIVMMLGVNDRQAIREVIRPAVTPPAPRASGASGTGPPGLTVPAPREPGADPKPDQPSAGQIAPPLDANPPQDAEQQPSIVAPEPTQRARPTVGGNFEYRSEKWEELYIKRIDDTIAALKASGVPVYWVGLPALRGTRSTADMQYLNELYRNSAEKAGIAYIEVWDGFIDEAGRFTVQGPDFEGQIRRLRSGDGVYFTKAGARKLAHYVEREIRRDLNRAVPVALPVPEEAPAQVLGARPAAPAAPTARPLVGPVVPLTATANDTTEELLGGSAPRPASDGLAAKVLVKGEPVSAAAGRADDFAWPPRVPTTDVTGPLPAAPSVAVAAPKPSQPSPPPVRQASSGAQQPSRVAQPQYPRPTGSYWRSPPPAWNNGGNGGGFFGLFRD